MDGDRERWNAKWRERAGELEMQARFLEDFAHLVPTHGKALDVAGGAGRNAIWLARHGLDVTLVDISDVALDKAEQRATRAGLVKKMRFLRVDLDRRLDVAPTFDVVLLCNYLDRKRRDEYVGLLHDEGIVVASQPTMKNLERNAKPSAQYLVELGELATWVTEIGLSVLASREDWNAENRHEAVVVAKRRPGVVHALPSREDSGPQEGPYR